MCGLLTYLVVTPELNPSGVEPKAFPHALLLPNRPDRVFRATGEIAGDESPGSSTAAAAGGAFGAARGKGDSRRRAARRRVRSPGPLGSLWAPSLSPSHQRTPPRAPGRSLDGFSRPAAWLRAGAAPRQGRRRVPVGCQDPGVGGHGRGGQRARRWAVERRRMGAAVGRVRGGGGDGGRDLEHVTHVIQVGWRPDRPNRPVPDRLMVCGADVLPEQTRGPGERLDRKRGHVQKGVQPLLALL